MIAHEIFADQIADNRLYTMDMVRELVKCGTLSEGSDEHQRHLDHVGERVLYALVYHHVEAANDTDDRVFDHYFKAVVERYFESNFESVVRELEQTHDHDGYTGTVMSVPRFTLKRK